MSTDPQLRPPYPEHLPVYQPGDVVEVLNSKCPTLRDAETSEDVPYDFWKTMGMGPVVIGARFVVREVRYESSLSRWRIVVYAGGQDNTGFPHLHFLDPYQVTLYRRFQQPA